MSDPIKDALKETLADYRLTRGEKRSLQQSIEPFSDDERRLALVRNYAFKMARDELSEPHHAELLNWLEDVVKVLQQKNPNPSGKIRSEAYFSPDDPCVSRIVRLFDSARKSVDICVYTITDDRIRDAILAAHHRNVPIRIISDNDKSDDLGSDIHQLDRRGVPVRVDRSEFHMHHKYAVFDGKQLLTGSYNWTRSAAQRNEENFLITNDATLLKSFRRAFDKLWKRLQ